MTRLSCLILAAILCPISMVQAATFVGARPEAPIPPLSETSVKHDQWLHKVMLEGYDTVGNHNPKWDEAARQALSLSVDMWGPPRVRGPGNLAQYEAAKKAVDAGCDDPMVLYVYGRTFRTFGNDQEACTAIHQRAADGMLKSKYCAYYRAIAQLRVAEHQMYVGRMTEQATGKPFDLEVWKQVVQRVETAIRMTGEVAKEMDLPLEESIEFGDGFAYVFAAGGGGLSNAVKSAYPRFEMTAPRGAALTVKGKLYTRWAWEARGSDFANTVTPDGWKLMQQRLDIAQQSLEEAWKLDNSNTLAATRMITVELGQGQGRDRMELWFKRAIDANPDNDEACSEKLSYLEPKWYGTPRDMILFGRECFKTGRFHTNIPDTLRLAHEKLSHYTHGGYSTDSDPAYYQTPGVWADLRDVYDGYLRAEKDSDPSLTRNHYAHDACRCEAWDDAAKMFAIMGDRFDSRVWTKADFESARTQALQNAKK